MRPTLFQHVLALELLRLSVSKLITDEIIAVLPSHSQFRLQNNLYLDLHGLVLETSIYHWQDQPGSDCVDCCPIPSQSQLAYFHIRHVPTHMLNVVTKSSDRPPSLSRQWDHQTIVFRFIHHVTHKTCFYQHSSEKGLLRQSQIIGICQCVASHKGSLYNSTLGKSLGLTVLSHSSFNNKCGLRKCQSHTAF